MSSDIGFDDEKAELEGLDLPEGIRQYIAEQTYPARYARYYTAYRVALTIGNAGLPAAVAYVLVDWSERLSDMRAAHAYFYDGNHGWSVLMVSFGLLLGCFGLFGRLIYVMPRRFAEYSLVRSFLDCESGEGLNYALTRQLIHAARRQARDETAFNYLAAINEKLVHWLARTGYVLIILSLGLIAIDFNQYVIGNQAGIEHHTVLGKRLTPWAAVKRVKVGCFVFEEGGPTGRYQLDLGGDEIVNAFPSRISQIRVLRLIPLNKRLRTSKVPFERATLNPWFRASQPLWSDDCAQRVAERTLTNAETILWLLDI